MAVGMTEVYWNTQAGLNNDSLHPEKEANQTSPFSVKDRSVRHVVRVNNSAYLWM